MRRLVGAVLTLFALLPLALVAPPAQAGAQPTDPYVKQASVRFRVTEIGGQDVRLVTLVNPTNSAVWRSISAGPSNSWADESVGTCVNGTVPANSSCTEGLVFQAPTDVGTYTYTQGYNFYNGQTLVGSDSVAVTAVFVIHCGRICIF